MSEADKKLALELGIEWGQLISYPSTDATFARLVRIAIAKTRRSTLLEVADEADLYAADTPMPGFAAKLREMAK